MTKKVLCLVTEGFEEIELVTPVDLLRRAGADVVMASLGEVQVISGRSGISIRTDMLLGLVDTTEYDLLLLPGGPGVGTLRSDGRPAKLAREFVEAGKLVAAICAAPTVLLDAGQLAGKKFTAHFSVQDELPASGYQKDHRVVRDGQVITSRGAGTALDFGLALIAALYSEEKAAEISASIMA